MKLLRYAAAILPFFALACSDDDKDATPKNTGTFAYGTVTGLHYKAGAYEGDTNAAGEFRYNDGDTVTFSVGAVELGSVPGAARVSPFELGGATPPRTEHELYKALMSEGVVTPLEKTLNIALFLSAIDGDNDLANGVDLTAAASALRDATLAFDEDPTIFAQQKLIPLIVEKAIGNVGASARRAAAQLFTAVGAELSAFIRATYAEDAGADGSIERTEASTLNERSQLTLTTVANAAGDIITRTETEFDSTGRVAKRVVRSNPTTPGAFANEHTTLNVYDAALGLLFTQTQEVRISGVLSQRTVIMATRDVYGSAVIEEARTDANGDGTFDTMRRITRDIDFNNRPTRVITTAYSDLGVTQVQRESVTSAYDAAGNESERVYEYDSNGDGLLEQRTVTSRAYDSSRRPITTRVEEQDGDGLPQEREVTTYTFDSSGLLTRTVRESDSGADDSVEYVTTTDRTYDANKQLTREFEDGVNGGLIHNLRTTDHTYDVSGNLLTTTLVVNQNSQANPAPDSIEKWTYTWNADNYDTTSLHERDSNADGTFEERSSTISTFTAVADGVAYFFRNDGY